MKVVTVLGARPQFIKAAALSRVFQKLDIQEIIIHTGQHYDQNMSDIFFKEMKIPNPNYLLQIASKHHGEMTGRMLEGVERILIAENPDAVLVYGDTNSTLAGALAASKLHIPIAHVEAGLRSFNRRMPEEINRVLTDHLSTWLFAPSESALTNLKHEGIDRNMVHMVGDVMYDAILYYQVISDRESQIIQKLDISERPYALVTIHRAENTNSPEMLSQIINALSLVAESKVLVFPVHPRTRNLMDINSLPGNIKVIDPVGYFDMIALQKGSRLIITDSGGIQKEAFLNRKYCITVRGETEWVELVEAGVNYLAQADNIAELVHRLWDRPFVNNITDLYGDGHAAEKIANVISKSQKTFK